MWQSIGKIMARKKKRNIIMTVEALDLRDIKNLEVIAILGVGHPYRDKLLGLSSSNLRVIERVDKISTFMAWADLGLDAEHRPVDSHPPG